MQWDYSGREREGMDKRRKYLTKMKLDCGPMPNEMAALLHIGGALCSMLQSLANAHYQNAVQ